MTTTQLNAMIIEFWGVRGTLTVPGSNTTKYGGNTNCVSVTFANKHFFIFDAGTGIKELSNHLMKENRLPLSAKIFITHPHYDHINGLPFFVPFYLPANEFEIFGATHSGMSIKELVAKQMDGVYFPVTTKAFSARLSYRALKEESFKIDDIHVKTMFLNHPGRSLGYRIEYQGKSFCYITDNELYLENSPKYDQAEVDRLIKFIAHADVVVMDTTYRDDEYCHKKDWGHSCTSRVVDVADKAKVKLLCLHHHSLDHVDSDIDSKLEQAQDMLKSRKSKTTCIAPCEGEKVVV